MDSINTVINQHYGNKLRVRVCGILIENNQILVVEHKNIGANGIFISPPGGGLQFGETIEDCLKREFLEETGLSVGINRFLFTNEYLDVPLHAIEMFFEVKTNAGILKKGIDPEMGKSEQIINNLYFISWDELKTKESGSVHQIFSNFNSLEDLIKSQSIIFKK